MSFVNERTSIENRLETLWNTTAIHWDNVSFTEPASKTWIKCNILNASSTYRAIDSKKKHIGLIILQIFVPINSGTAVVRGYADSLAAIFENQNFDDVVCGIASIEKVGINTVSYQINVKIPYRRDEP